MTTQPATTDLDRTYRATGILLVLVAVSAAIVLAGLFEPWWPLPQDLRAYLDVSNEISLPTWWNTALLVLAGALMLAVAGVAPGRRERTAWALVGGLVALMSLDEASMLHERLALVGSHWWPAAELHYMWLLLGVPLAAAVVLFVVLAARGLPGRIRWAVLGAFGLYFAGAVGAEIAQELILQADGHWFARRFLAHPEEGLEMTGAALLVVAPLARLQRPQVVGDPSIVEVPSPLDE